MTSEAEYKYAIGNNDSKCCCCHIWHDDFDRTDINELGQRYHFATPTVFPGDFGYPGLITWNQTSNAAWSIVAGALTCDSEKQGCRLAANSTNSPPLNTGSEVAWCFDLTFTGTGKVYLGYHVVLDFDSGRIYLNDIYCDKALSSGTTYRVRVVYLYNGCEIWVDDVLVLSLTNLSSTPTSWGNWYFIGSGVLAIDNLDIYIVNATGVEFPGSTGYRHCFEVPPCWFPYQLDLPPQIQLEIIDSRTNTCGACGNPFVAGNFGGNATYILDLASPCPALQGGGDTSCACYQLAGTFGCYTLLSVKIDSGRNIEIDWCYAGVGGTGGCAAGQPNPPLQQFWGGLIDDGAGKFKFAYPDIQDELTLSRAPAANGCFIVEAMISIL